VHLGLGLTILTWTSSVTPSRPTRPCGMMMTATPLTLLQQIRCNLWTCCCQLVGRVKWTMIGAKAVTATRTPFTARRATVSRTTATQPYSSCPTDISSLSVSSSSLQSPAVSSATRDHARRSLYARGPPRQCQY